MLVKVKLLFISNFEIRMKKFILQIIYFFSSIGGLLATIDFFYSQFAIQSNFYPIESWYSIMKGEINADIIIMGNSHAFVQVDPTILDKVLSTNAFNLGMMASPINRQIHKYNVYRKYNKKPKIIIQNIDYLSLDYKVGCEKEQFIPYFWNKDIRTEFFPDEPFSFWEKYIPMCRYLNISPWTLISIGHNNLNKGYMGVDKQWNGENFMGTDSVSFTSNETTVRMFDDYLSKAYNEGIKFVFVYAPVYVGATYKIKNLDKMHTQYQLIAQKYNIPILDYTKMEICNDTSYFYNGTHLNISGSRIYSDSLAHDIQKMRILQH